MAFMKWFNEGNTNFQKNRYKEAIECWKKALEIGRKLQDDQVQAKSLMNIGTAYKAQEDWNKALNFFHQGLEVEKKMGDQASIADALMNIGDIFFALKQWDNAQNYYMQSLETYSKEDRNKARILFNFGLSLFHNGKWKDSIKYYKKSLDLFEKLRDIDGISATLANLGIVSRNLGLWDDAIKYYKQGLEIDRQMEDKQGEATSLLNIGIALEVLGKVKEAIKYYQRSLVIFRELGDEKAIATCLLNIGNAFQIIKKWNKALQFYEQSLKLFKELRDKSNISKCLTNVGIALGNLGDWDRAVLNFQNSIKWFESVHDQAALSKALVDLGVAYYNKGEVDRAIESYYKSRELFRKLGDRPGEALACQNLGWAYRKQNKNQKALKYFSEALGIYTTLITPISDEEFRESYAKEFIELPKVIAGLTDMLTQSVESQGYQEIASGKNQMSELLTQLKTNIMNLNITMQLKHEYQDISENIRNLMNLVERTTITFSQTEQMKKETISRAISNSIEVCNSFFALHASCIKDADSQALSRTLKELQAKLNQLFPELDINTSITEKVNELAAMASRKISIADAFDLQYQILIWIGRLFNIAASNMKFYEAIVGKEDEVSKSIEEKLENLSNRLKIEEINYSKRILSYLIVIKKNSGIPLYQWNFIEASFDSTLVGGFLTAIQSFGSEISREKASMEKLAYKNFEINFQDGKYIRLALILRGGLTELLARQMKSFVLDFETKFEKPLAENKGNLTLFDSSDTLIKKHFIL
ncbi:MAG: tetratricopeptide repeat protein [Candidatus Helarchaeota archaeon]